ncbi:hypothetical protein PFISCL1PPCAC_1006, partial [Pristionchus fissidentatus]
SPFRMSDSEDDFMSDKFLAGTEEIRPGLAKTSHQRRIMKIENERAEAEAERLRLQKKKKPVQIESERREEVMAVPISTESKGFALMAKMGFKPGMSLGKKKDENDLGSGIKVPINIVVRNHRGGLGTESAEIERVKKEESSAKVRIEAQMKRMKERARMTDDLSDDYRKRARLASSRKQMVGDIVKSRKACHEMDMRKELELPEEPWFWPSYREKKKEEEGEATTSRVNKFQTEGEEEDVKYHYSNGKEAPKEEQLNEMTDDVLEERLEAITVYLRSMHFYCVWCGCAFDHEEDMDGGCPGPDRMVHDD